MKRTITIVAGGGVFLAAATACGATHPAAPVSCTAQYKTWQHGPAKALALTFVADLRKVNAAADIQDVPQLTAALKQAGADATALQAYPMPRCADPAGYWHHGLASIRAAADNANTGSGMGALMTAMGPAQQAQTAFETKLGPELRRTVPAAITR